MQTTNKSRERQCVSPQSYSGVEKSCAFVPLIPGESPTASEMSFSFDSMCMNAVGFVMEGSVFCVMMTSLSVLQLFSRLLPPINTF